MVGGVRSPSRVTGIADTDLAPGAKWQALVPHNHARREDERLAENAE
jgi:hypothetical protein